jgi:hypothetical protein
VHQRAPYGNGLTFQAISIFFIETSGISMQDLQLFVYPSLAALLPIAAFIFYRVLTGNTITALFATLLLFVQPDFLFGTWRGSHEKFTWFLTLLLLFAITRSFLLLPNRQSLFPTMIAFYFLSFSFISTNAFFASSFVAALALSFIGGLVWLRLRRGLRRQLAREVSANIWRLLFITLVCGILLYLFFFFIYPPALSLLRTLGNLAEGLSALFLATNKDSVPEAVNAYDYVTGAYVDPWVFLILSGFSFALTGFSGLVWLSGVPRYLFQRNISKEDLPRILLWLIYAGFAFQLVLSVFADRVGTVGANVQVRLFTPMALISVPLAAIGIHGIIKRLRPPHLQKGAILLSAPLLMFVSILAVLKMSNDPLVSNNWIFTTEPERRSAEWLIGNSEDSIVWEGRTLRQRYYLPFYDPQIATEYFRAGPIPATTRYYLSSELERAMWSRNDQPTPYLEDEQLIYDNGQVQVYYRRPFTPYQR